MRFAYDGRKINAVDALDIAPPRWLKCIVCGGPVFLRGGGLEGFTPHYVHVRRGACGYYPECDRQLALQQTRRILEEVFRKEDPILC